MNKKLGMYSLRPEKLKEDPILFDAIILIYEKDMI